MLAGVSLERNACLQKIAEERAKSFDTQPISNQVLGGVFQGLERSGQKFSEETKQKIRLHTGTKLQTQLRHCYLNNVTDVYQAILADFDLNELSQIAQHSSGVSAAHQKFQLVESDINTLIMPTLIQRAGQLILQTTLFQQIQAQEEPPKSKSKCNWLRQPVTFISTFVTQKLQTLFS